MKEKWKPVKGYEKIYQVSNLGRVKSNDKEVRNRSGIFIKKGRVLKPGESKIKYPLVALCDKGKQKSHYVHRLVLIAFLPNPHNKATVNHKNGIRNDNNLSNL